jgi:hypothetical protein
MADELATLVLLVFKDHFILFVDLIILNGWKEFQSIFSRLDQSKMECKD